METVKSFRSNLKRVILWVFVFFVVIFVFGRGNPFFTVSPGEVALIVRLGELQNLQYAEGFHRKTPFLDQVIYMNVQSQKTEAQAEAASKDLQTISTNIAAITSLDPKSLQNIYRTIGEDDMISDKIIQPAIQESVKSAISKYTAEELITKRPLVSDDIKKNLTDKLSKFGIIVSDINITNFQFSAGFDKSIEEKVAAEQDALAEKNKLEKIKYQAQQKIEQSKAEAESIRIQAEAVKSQGGAEYINLKRIEKRDGKLPQTVLGDKANILYNMGGNTNTTSGN